MIFVVIMNIIDIIEDKHKDNAKRKHNHNDLSDFIIKYIKKGNTISMISENAMIVHIQVIFKK